MQLIGWKWLLREMTLRFYVLKLTDLWGTGHHRNVKFVCLRHSMTDLEDGIRFWLIVVGLHDRSILRNFGCLKGSEIRTSAVILCFSPSGSLKTSPFANTQMWLGSSDLPETLSGSASQYHQHAVRRLLQGSRSSRAGRRH